MSFNAPSDFTAIHKISTNQYTTTELQNYIDMFEVTYLQNLLGVELYDLFQADYDITGTGPTAARFVDIYNAFAEDNAVLSFYWPGGWYDYFIYDTYFLANNQVQSFGILDMLKGFVYFDYTRDANNNSTVVGNVENTFSNSVQTPFPSTQIFTNYNRSIQTYRAIQWFILKNDSVYPEFEGIRKGYANWL